MKYRIMKNFKEKFLVWTIRKIFLKDEKFNHMIIERIPEGIMCQYGRENDDKLLRIFVDEKQHGYMFIDKDFNNDDAFFFLYDN
mgnify:CR=1 FL=1